jgi:hypothetical protein
MVPHRRAAPTPPCCHARRSRASHLSKLLLFLLLTRRGARPAAAHGCAAALSMRAVALPRGCRAPQLQAAAPASVTRALPVCAARPRSAQRETRFHAALAEGAVQPRRPALARSRALVARCAGSPVRACSGWRRRWLCTCRWLRPRLTRLRRSCPPAARRRRSPSRSRRACWSARSTTRALSAPRWTLSAPRWTLSAPRWTLSAPRWTRCTRRCDALPWWQPPWRSGLAHLRRVLACA